MPYTQPQLIPMALVESDIIYTPDDVARDVVNFFKPTGRILEPSAGDGAFLKYLPEGTEWCEIEKGRDFFAEHRHFDWIVGNPPYSLFDEWITHSFELADNVVYVLYARTVFNALSRLKRVDDYGGIKTIYILGGAAMFKNLGAVGYDTGLPVAAVHFQRGYRGGTFTVFRDIK